MAKMKSYAGTVDRFLVEKSDFLVFRFQPRADQEDSRENAPFTCVLKSSGVSENDALLVKGYWRKHETYGWQFWVVDYAPTMPTSAPAIEAYLSAGNIEGIGPELAGRLVRRFGQKTMEVMQSDPVALTSVEGIGAGKADVIHAHTLHLIKLQGIHRKLADWGVPADTTSKIVEDHQEKAEAYIRSNPWQIMMDYQETLKTGDRVAELSESGEPGQRLQAVGDTVLEKVRARSGKRHAYPVSLLQDCLVEQYPDANFDWTEAFSHLKRIVVDSQVFMAEADNLGRIKALLAAG